MAAVRRSVTGGWLAPVRCQGCPSACMCTIQASNEACHNNNSNSVSSVVPLPLPPVLR